MVDWVESVLGGLRVVRRAPTPEPTYDFALCLWIRLKFFFKNSSELSGNVAEDVALSRPSALESEVTCFEFALACKTTLRVSVACRRLYFVSVDGDRVGIVACRARHCASSTGAVLGCIR